jgi:hypothetical protein
LGDKFPNSPRVDVLTGIRMEATESPNVVLQYYHELLQADSTNAVSNLILVLFSSFVDAANFSGDLETTDIGYQTDGKV